MSDADMRDGWMEWWSWSKRIWIFGDDKHEQHVAEFDNNFYRIKHKMYTGSLKKCQTGFVSNFKEWKVFHRIIPYPLKHLQPSFLVVLVEWKPENLMLVETLLMMSEPWSASKLRTSAEASPSTVSVWIRSWTKPTSQVSRGPSSADFRSRKRPRRWMLNRLLVHWGLHRCSQQHTKMKACSRNRKKCSFGRTVHRNPFRNSQEDWHEAEVRTSRTSRTIQNLHTQTDGRRWIQLISYPPKVLHGTTRSLTGDSATAMHIANLYPLRTMLGSGSFPRTLWHKGGQYEN